MVNTSRLILQPHPACVRAPIAAIVASADLASHVLTLEFECRAARSRLRLPTAPGPIRTDELWRQTCFEAFIGIAHGEDYLEWNGSMTGAWALYRFSGYRSGMTSPALAAPTLECRSDGDDLHVRVQFDRRQWPAPWQHGSLQLGLAAVLESDDGQLHYYALHHPLDRPDFHDARARLVTL